MTSAERALIDAACQAVDVERVVALLTRDPEKLSALVRAVVRLKNDRSGDYWRET